MRVFRELNNVLAALPCFCKWIRASFLISVSNKLSRGVGTLVVGLSLKDLAELVINILIDGILGLKQILFVIM